jgi:Abnormal spindle-like microcephaly-assoc'd, ASPM-SPD-2-Hydin
MFRVGTVVRTLTLCSLPFATIAFAKDNSKTIETFPSGFAVSQRVSDLPLELAVEKGEEIHEPGAGPLRFKTAGATATPQEDQVLQKEAKPLVAATLGVSFSGIPSPGYVPSDSNLAVGPNEIVEVVNVQFAVYNKNGATLAGPTNIQTLFAPLGGVCASTYGDPVVLYDRAADRWVLSDIGTNSAGSVGAECVAVSKTNDPTGAYYLYGYSFGANLNDYPKLSTWATATNSAYLSTYNIFQNFLSFTGADLCAFDRTKMLAGDASAAQLCKKTPSSEFGYLPSDMDGPTSPADGTPGLFISWYNNNPGQLYLRSLSVDFSKGTATLLSPTVISVANSSLACGNGGQCVPQAGTTQTLDSLGDRLMYRFAIRHFADHDRAVVNHAVSTAGQVAVRWYEIYDPAGSVTLNQQGTFAPDTTYRWMASLAEDQAGNIGLGYSASSTGMHPAIRFTGRVPSDAAGTMESENTIVQGAGSQVGSDAYRWGDYTAMQVDPSDDCTFWYVDQYQALTGTFDWSTNISSFAFNSCSGSPSFSLAANPGSVSVAQGSNATTSIAVNALNGFSGSVRLSATGLPSGVTAGFSTNPTTSSSTLTFTASVTAPTGTSSITVKGVSGSLTEQTSVQLTVTGGGTGPVVSLSPASLKWFKYTVGTKACCQTVTLTNRGTSTLDISGISATGDFGTKTVAQSCGSTVAAGESCIVKVSFTPTQTGTRAGALKFADNAPGSPQSVSLSGTGQ